MAEELMRRGAKFALNGMPDDRRIWSAISLVDSKLHQIVQDGHLAYLRAGAQSITTNNYAVTSRVFNAEEIARHTETAGRLARKSVQRFEADGGPPGALVAGSLPP